MHALKLRIFWIFWSIKSCIVRTFNQLYKYSICITGSCKYPFDKMLETELEIRNGTEEMEMSFSVLVSCSWCELIWKVHSGVLLIHWSLSSEFIVVTIFCLSHMPADMVSKQSQCQGWECYSWVNFEG